MDLSELTAYAGEKYQMQEQHKWADFPGFSVLCHPQTGKWVALLMRQWDSDSGAEIQRCDLKCGADALSRSRKPYITPPARMRGNRWLGVRFDETTERRTVFELMDRAVALENRQGCTIVLDARLPEKEAGYRETALPDANACQPAQEQLPERLRSLRRLFGYERNPSESRAEDFRRQAVFMQDYEDDYPWTGGDAVRYFPTYRDLTTRQLRGYFTWRARLRRGDYRPIATSAAYIYVYELLNGVGAVTPEEILKKLMEFDREYLASGVGDKRMRANLRRWMLEYAVLHDLPPELAREAADPELLAWDSAISALRTPETHTDREVFSALCHFDGGKMENSPVLAGDPERGARLFSRAWGAALRYCRKGKNLFALCFGEPQTRAWYPLSNAVYEERLAQKDRDYALNDCRRFRLRDGIWQTEAYEKLFLDKKLLQGFLHEADARLRRCLKTGRYLREKAEDEWAIPYIDSAIEADRKAVAEASRPDVTIDLAGLDRIRRDAVITRDSLLIDEPEEEGGVAEAADAAPAPEAEHAVDGIQLDDVQVQILRALLEGRDASAIIREHHLMPTIVADAVNEAFFDEIGDTVLLCEGDALALVEDYIEDVAHCLGGTNHG